MSNLAPKQDLNKFFKHASFAFTIAKKANFAVLFLLKKPCPFPIKRNIIVHQHFYFIHFFNTLVKIKKFIFN